MISWVYAQNSNNQIEEELYKIDPIVQTDLEFQIFSSCEDMNQTLETYIKDNWKHRWGPRIMPMMRWGEEMMILEESAADIAVISNKSSVPPQTGGVWGWSPDDFSLTNTQVKGVDEPDILKNDGDYIYYVNQKESKVQIIKSPYPDTKDFEYVASITLPKVMNGAQLFLKDEKLVIMANRYREVREQGFLNNNSKTDVIVYDVSTPSQPQLIKFTELDGNYMDARLIDGELTILSSLWLNRYRPGQYRDTAEDVKITSSDILPKNIDIAYTTDTSKQNLSTGDEKFPYAVSINKANCTQINYVLPTSESTTQLGLDPSFTIISTIDIDNVDDAPTTTIAFGNTQSNHLSLDNLYLTTGIRVPSNSSCPINARCIRNGGFGNQQTLIHKFGRDNGVYTYANSALVSGSPLTQYSMDEDAAWNFRILTSIRDRESSTNFYVLDQDLNLAGKVENIEPGEEFKSSRYIWDKLYLVTFERTDPLFVIDIQDIYNPEIIWELKIPWFSTYLHPHSVEKDGVQYLLWLWFDATENQRWGIENGGIKVDMYKIDYNNTDSKGMIATTQEYTETFGDNGSQTEATYNPRMFVRDSNNSRLFLPLQLNQSSNTQNCNIVYGPNDEELSRECRDNNDSKPVFRWYTALEITPDAGIQELESHNFIDILKKDKNVFQERYLNTRDLMPRVGYLNGNDKTTMYMINGMFGQTTILGTDNANESYINLSSKENSELE